MSQGDVVFSFCDARIKAFEVATGAAQTGAKPDFDTGGANWSRELVARNVVRLRDCRAVR